MKRNILLLLLMGLCVAGCSDFPTMFDRIDSDKLRLLDFIYEPADAAPGDTVTVRAIFAGKEVTAPEIDWNISFNVIQNVYGSDSAFDKKPLSMLPVEQSEFSGATSCISVRFKIPEDVMYTSGGVPENWSNGVPHYMRNEIPSEFRSLSKSQILNSFDSLAAMVETTDPAILQQMVEMNPDLDKVSALLQFLTIKIRLFADIGSQLRIESDYSVRYNSRMKNMPGVYMNNNPDKIDSIGILKVPGTINSYTVSENNHTFFPFEDSATIKIEKGYSYFVAIFPSKSSIDMARSLENAITGTSQQEKLMTQWFFALDPDETSDISPNDFMNIVNMRGLVAHLLPPAKGQIKKFTIWCHLYDELMTELNRPQGSYLYEIHGTFEYTQEYLDSVKKK